MLRRRVTDAFTARVAAALRPEPGLPGNRVVPETTGLILVAKRCAYRAVRRAAGRRKRRPNTRRVPPEPRSPSAGLF